MRLSTIGIVLAVFAIGGHAYASLFAIPVHSTSAAAWPTFVDASRVIKSVSDPFAQPRQVVSHAIAGLRAPRLGSPRISQPLVGRSTNSNGKTSASRKVQKRAVPPLPVVAPEKDKVLRAKTAKPIDLPQLHAELVNRRAKRLVQATPAGTSERNSRIITGTIRQVAWGSSRNNERVRRVEKNAPPFDVKMRSALGGPKPALVKPVTRVAVIIPPSAGIAIPGKTADSSQIPLVTLPARLVKAPVPNLNPKRVPRESRILRSASSPRLVKVSLPTVSPLRAQQITTPERQARNSVPALRPLGRSLSIVRIEPPALRPKPRLPQRRKAQRRKKVAALRDTRVRNAGPLIQRPTTSVAKVQRNAATPKASVRKKKLRRASKVKRRSVRRTRRAAPRRANRQPRRVARANKPRRRTARRAYRHSAGTLWGRQAASSSMF